MSSYRLSLSTLAFALSSFFVLQADPLVVIPPGNLSCSVTATFHGPLTKDSPAPDEAKPVKPAVTVPRIGSMQITRVGKLQRDDITWSDGTASQTWTLTDLGLTLLEKMTGSTSFIYELPRGSTARLSLSPTILDLDATSLTWIKPQSFTGKTTHEGKAALHYQATMPVYDTVPLKYVAYQAWIDPKTLAPLAFDDGDSFYELTFSAPPTEPLVLPARFQKDLQQYENANAKIRHL